MVGMCCVQDSLQEVRLMRQSHLLNYEQAKAAGGSSSDWWALQAPAQCFLLRRYCTAAATHADMQWIAEGSLHRGRGTMCLAAAARVSESRWHGQVGRLCGQGLEHHA